MVEDPDGRAVRLLLDTNVLVSHETATAMDQYGVSAAYEFVQLARELGFELLVSNGSRRDFTRASPELRKRRMQLLDKYYRTLQPVPENDVVRAEFPDHPSPNDQADIEVLSTYATGLPTALVTDDERMKRRARRAGLQSVFTVDEAVDWLRTLGAPTLSNAASAEMVLAYQVNVRAALFDSLKSDYDFERWWTKVVHDERPVIVLGDPSDPIGIAVLKTEQGTFDLGPRVLKICTFKVDDGEGRSRRGELLLRAVIDYAAERDFAVAYLTAWPHHDKLLSWLARFGFVRHSETNAGEIVAVKRLRPEAGAAPLAPLEHAITYGPRSVRVDRAHVVPIQHHFHNRLLPDSDIQSSLFGNEDCGNAIRKAYLCRAGTRQLAPGHLLLLLRTEPGVPARVTAVGVVERTLVSDDARKVAAFVRGRTVYPYEEIDAMCASREVLAILFRLDRRIEPPWPVHELAGAGVVKVSPQSIAEVREEGVAWIRTRLGA